MILSICSTLLRKKIFLMISISIQSQLLISKKIKNLLIAKLEKKDNKTKLTSKPYRVIVDPTNACNLGCPLCPTGLGASERTKKC